jgi:energy-coupling factor transporter ATP-binding protein EcfA2
MTTFDPEKITYFAKTDARGALVPFGIKAKDRQRHMYVVGKTGMGKSTLLENMAAQDILNGEGMAFIDPHGSAAEVLLEYIPEHRIKDVVYFAPFDMDNPVAFNVMEDVGEDKRHLVVSGLMSTFKKIWVDAWSARMEYILTNALLALIEYPDTTLLSVNRMFADKAYREKVVDFIKDPAVKSFWVDEFASYTDRYIAESVPAIQNKIGQFTGNPLIRNIIGQPHSSFDIRQMMDEKKILIMNLSKGLIGETNANLLGSMLTTRIYLAAMSRADIPVHIMKTMPNFYFYVDEFQSFANSTFANILSEARKYHLNLIIAHQYIAQMEEEVRDAVFGNVGTTVTFRVGPFDAEVLETVFTPTFLAADLVNLGFAQIYLTLMIDGVGSQPFSAQTLPPLERPSVSFKGMAIESSRALYANKRADVEQVVADLHTPTPQPEKPKKIDPRKLGGGNGGNGTFNNSNGNGGGVSARPPLRQPDVTGAVSVPASITTRSNENNARPEERQDVRVRTDRSTGSNDRPERSNGNFVRRDVQPQRKPEDLRAILGKMSQAQTQAPTVKKDGVEVVSKEKEVSPHRAELKDLLASLVPATQSQVATPAPAPRPVLEITENKPEVSAMSSVGERVVRVPVQVESPVATERDVPLTAPPVTGHRRPAPQYESTAKTEDSNNIDPSVVKRMLRDHHQERSPFA